MGNRTGEREVDLDGLCCPVVLSSALKCVFIAGQTRRAAAGSRANGRQLTAGGLSRNRSSMFIFRLCEVKEVHPTRFFLLEGEEQAYQTQRKVKRTPKKGLTSIGGYQCWGRES